jgi:lipopolysaccharide export system protein LptA
MPSPTGLSIKSIGLIAAGALALIFTGIILISMLFATPAPTNDQDDAFPDPDEILNIEQTQTGGSMLVTMVDQNDPTRVSSTLRAERFEPIGEGRRRLDQPESWIFLKDGRAVRVNADTATMLMPDPNQAPESGTLEGNIVIRTYDTTPAQGAPAPDDQEPTLVARFDEPLEFERRYLRMRSPGRFSIESDRVDVSGTDLTIILNNLKDRIELIDVMQGDQIVIHTDTLNEPAIAEVTPDQPSRGTQTDSQRTPATGGETNTTPEVTATAPIPTPEIQHYRIALDEDIHAELAGSGQVFADSLELWTTLVDGRIPDNAVRQIALAQETPTASKDTSSPETRAPSTPTTQASSTPSGASIPSATGTQGDDLIINWTGPMRVRPIDDDLPPQLEKDRLALRLDSAENSGISMNAPERGFTGQAKQLTYFATRGIADLKGEQTELGIVKLEVEDTGTLFAESLNANLATGQISMLQRGSITTLNADPKQVASVRWKDRASIKFAIDEDGTLTQRLENARFEGAAIAEQAGNSLGARVINTELDPELPPVAALTRVVLEDGVIASADKQTLTGKEVLIDFEPDADPQSPPHPTRVSSIGSSMGRTPDQMLRADEMHADLVRDISGKTLISNARAAGNVVYRDSSRTTASADELLGDGINEIITLKGDEAEVTKAGSTITGPHINLRAKRRSVEVIGEGTFAHDIALSETPGATPGLKGQVNARWSQSMLFEDTLGTVECKGDVRVISTPDALTRDTLKADRVTINMTPMPTNDPVANQQSPERQLISARASGRAQPGQAPVPASIETRTYAADNPELAIGVLYLEGAQILADNEQQTLTVPGAGTLLILDRQGDEDQVEPESDRPLDGSGLSRFTWESRMVLDRAAGEGTFTGSVAVDHKSLNSDARATLNTDSLVAYFETGQSEDPASEASGTNTLRSAIAEGSVRFIYANSELLSDRAEYDAIADSLFASALDNSRVTLYRNDGSPPTAARTIFWDLANDQLRINAPSPVRTTPGG